MRILTSEIRRFSIRYKQHYFQYTLLTVTMCALFLYGISYKVDTTDVTMYDRLLLFNMIYYLAVIRMVASGLSNVYNEISSEITESKLIYNITASGYDSHLIVLVRTIVKSMCSILITYVSIVCITILLGVDFSYYNYFQMFIQLIIGNIMLFGIGFGFSGLCNLFNMDKQIAVILEFFLIIFMIIVPLENEFIPINFVKGNIYGILYNDIMLSEVTVFWSNSNLLALTLSIVILGVGICLYNFTNYLKLKKRWKVYEG